MNNKITENTPKTGDCIYIIYKNSTTDIITNL